MLRFEQTLSQCCGDHDTEQDDQRDVRGPLKLTSTMSQCTDGSRFTPERKRRRRLALGGLKKLAEVQQGRHDDIFSGLCIVTEVCFVNATTFALLVDDDSMVDVNIMLLYGAAKWAKQNLTTKGSIILLKDVPFRSGKVNATYSYMEGKVMGTESCVLIGKPTETGWDNVVDLKVNDFGVNGLDAIVNDFKEKLNQNSRYAVLRRLSITQQKQISKDNKKVFDIGDALKFDQYVNQFVDITGKMEKATQSRGKDSKSVFTLDLVSREDDSLKGTVRWINCPFTLRELEEFAHKNVVLNSCVVRLDLESGSKYLFCTNRTSIVKTSQPTKSIKIVPFYKSILDLLDNQHTQGQIQVRTKIAKFANPPIPRLYCKRCNVLANSSESVVRCTNHKCATYEQQKSEPLHLIPRLGKLPPAKIIQSACSGRSASCFEYQYFYLAFPTPEEGYDFHIYLNDEGAMNSVTRKLKVEVPLGRVQELSFNIELTHLNNHIWSAIEDVFTNQSNRPYLFTLNYSCDIDEEGVQLKTPEKVTFESFDFF